MGYGECICEADLKNKRGWTTSLIRKYLSEPDMFAPNPNCPSGTRDMRLHLTHKIMEIESRLDFQKDFAKAKQRSEAHRRTSPRLLSSCGY